MKVQIDHAKSWHAIHRGICVSLLDQYLDPDHPGTTFPTLKASKEPPNHDQDHDPVLFFFFFFSGGDSNGHRRFQGCQSPLCTPVTASLSLVPMTISHDKIDPTAKTLTCQRNYFFHHGPIRNGKRVELLSGYHCSIRFVSIILVSFIMDRPILILRQC